MASFPLIECQCGARLGVSYIVPKPLNLQLPDRSRQWVEIKADLQPAPQTLFRVLFPLSSSLFPKNSQNPSLWILRSELQTFVPRLTIQEGSQFSSSSVFLRVLERKRPPNWKIPKCLSMTKQGISLETLCLPIPWNNLPWNTTFLHGPG